MSQSERERALRKLVAQWRDGGRWISAVNDETQEAYNYCADELEALLATIDTPQEPTPDPEHLPKGKLLGDTANELAKIAEALKTTNALRGREVFEIAVRIGWWANAVEALEAQDTTTKPAAPPDATLAGAALVEMSVEIVRLNREIDSLRASAPRPALSPDALLVQKILEDAANLLDDYWLHDAKGNLIATKGNLRAAILGLKSKYLRAPAPREGV